MENTRPARVSDSVVLVILDGWGIAPESPWNAISQANTPNFRFLEREFGLIQICASGLCVGLTRGQMGNSEVGHLTIGAGRIVFQDLTRVGQEIRSGRLAKNKQLLTVLRKAKRRGSTVHFLGLVSDGGVHSHIEHLFALLNIAKECHVKKNLIHVFLDGRDTSPKSGIDYSASLKSFLDSLGIGLIATISGRYYAMDRDNRWDRTKLAYDAIVYGKGLHFDDPIISIKESYNKGINDEFMIPSVIGDYQGVREGNTLIFFNFRPDRARQMTRALILSAQEFGGLFDRNEKMRPKKIDFVSMTIYDTKLKKVKSLLKRERITNTLSNILEKNKIRQLRIAETEKYAHVTYFFNGLVEKPRSLEDRILVPSVRIGTYDKLPEMSAMKIAQNAISAIDSGKYGFILINFANADMVGHSGNVEATIKAIEIVDQCLGKIYHAWKGKNEKMTIMVTADHGNAEKLFNQSTGQPHTAHTSNPVPLMIVSRKWRISRNTSGSSGLADLSPSILKIMGFDQPKVMTGQSIVESV